MRHVIITILTLTLVSVRLFAQEADATESDWRLEFLVHSGVSSVLDIKDSSDPNIGTAAPSTAFALSLLYDLGGYFSLSFGLSASGRGGLTWMNGTPFEVWNNSIHIPVLLHSTSFLHTTQEIDVFLQYGIGAAIGVPIEQRVHEIPGIPFDDKSRFEAGFLDFLTLSIVADIRFGLRFQRDLTLIVGFRFTQDPKDLHHFAVSDDALLIPLYRFSGVTLGISRRVF